MHVKKLDDSKVDEIIKMADKEELHSHPNPEPENPENNALPNAGSKQTLGTIIIFILLALSLVQSVELINLRTQIQKGQFNAAAAGAPAAPGGAQGLPAQQGGC